MHAIATNWFQGSALEPTKLQALPAERQIADRKNYVYAPFVPH